MASLSTRIETVFDRKIAAIVGFVGFVIAGLLGGFFGIVLFGVLVGGAYFVYRRSSSSPSDGSEPPDVDDSTDADTEKPGDDECLVTGTVVRGERPVRDATVEVFDATVRGEERLGESTTNSDGRYRVIYSRSDSRGTRRKAADVVAYVYNEVGERIGESTVRHNVGPEATVDVEIPAERTIEPTEYARLRSELERVLAEASLEELSESRLTFLASDLELEARPEYPAGEQSIAILRDAMRIASKSPFTVQALYGLGRQRDGLGGRDELADAAASELVSDLVAADEAGVVDVDASNLDERLESGLAALREALELAAKHESQGTVRLQTPEQRPLVNYDVQVSGDSDPVAGQTLGTDDAGEVDFAFLVDEIDQSREFEVAVLNDADTVIHEETVSLADGEVRTLTVDDAHSGSAGNVSIGSILSGDAPAVSDEPIEVGGDPSAVADQTLDAIRMQGLPDDSRAAGGSSATNDDGSVPDSGVTGAASVADVVDVTGDAVTTGTVGPSPVAARTDGATVDSLATLELAADLESGATLANLGYVSQVAVATTSAGDFRRSVGDNFPADVAELVHSRATAQTFYLDNRMLERRTALANGHFDWEPPTDDSPTNGGGS